MNEVSDPVLGQLRAQKARLHTQQYNDWCRPLYFTFSTTRIID